MVTKSKATKPKVAYGHTTESFGADPSDIDKSYEFRLKVVSLDDVITSHKDNFVINTDYPKELQPRHRDRAASRTLVDRMATNLNPRALLHDTGFLDTGPMIVGSDNVVESGNGRTIALRKAYEDYPDKYATYKAMLERMAERYGISQSELVGIDKPVLVRERITPVDRVAFAAEANVGAVMGMSPFEQALQDAGKLSDTVINTLVVGEEQSIDEALRARANAHIVSHYMKMIPANERATVSDAKGKVNQSGILRLKMAIFAKTYSGDAGERLTRTFSESLDPEVKRLENAMFQSLPDMAKAESLIGSGQRDADLTIAPDLAEVVETIAGLKQTGVTIADYLKQAEMFGDRLTPLQRRILAHLGDIGRSSKKTRTFLREIAQNITDAPIAGQVSFMGIEAPTKGDIVNGIIDRQRTEHGLTAIPSTTAVPTGARLAEPVTAGVESTGGLGTGIQRGLSTPDVVIAARTSVQPGLMGIGPEGAQVEAFGEWGTAPGAGGGKVSLVDAEALKAAEAGKPLPGQIGLEQAIPIDDTLEQWQKQINAAIDYQYLVVKSGGMATKSLVDAFLIKRYGLSESEAHDISNHIEMMPRYFSTGREGIEWNEYNAKRPEPQLKDYPDLKPKKTKKTRKPRRKLERLYKSEILEIEESRTPRAQSTDSARSHNITVPVTSKRTKTWAKNQGSMDIQGIDTPRKKKAKKTKKTTRKQKPNASMGSIR